MTSIRYRRAAVAFLLIGVLGCKGDEASNEPSGGVAPTAPAKPAARAAVPLAKIDAAAARALLDQWLAAQNQGDFDAYQALYAPKLEGIKRVGKRKVSFDRAGWLADRKRMFQRKMEVELSDLMVTTSSSTARARFTQKWASGKYQDIGPKEILLIRVGGELRIAREEMLESEIVSAPGGRKKLADDGFLFVVTLDDGDYVVLGDGRDLRHGKPVLVDNGEDRVYSARAPVADRDLPAELSSWRGREVTDGRCRLKVTGFALFHREVPHVSTVMAWSGEASDYDGEPTAPATQAQIAEDVIGGDPRLAGKLEGQCQVGLYVRAVDQPAWLEAERVNDEALAARAVTAFRKLPAYRKTQAEYRAEESDNPVERWDEYEGSGVEVSAFRHPKTDKVWVVARATGGVGCGSFAGAVTALFQADDRGGLKLVEGDAPLYGSVVRALDLEGDGELEWVLEPDRTPESWILVRTNGEELREEQVGYYDCDC